MLQFNICCRCHEAYNGGLIHNASLCVPLKCLHGTDTFIQKTKKQYADTRTQRNIDRLNDDLTEVHSIMTRNIQDVLSQGERLDRKSLCLSACIKQHKIATISTMPLLIQHQSLLRAATEALTEVQACQRCLRRSQQNPSNMLREQKTCITR